MLVIQRKLAVVLVLVAASAMTPVGCVSQIGVDPPKAYMDARMVLRRALDDQDGFTRANAIEALADTLGAQSGPTFTQALADPSPAVRFAAAMAVGDAQYAPAKDRLAKMAKDRLVEPDRRVMPGVIYAIFRLGDDSGAGDLYALLFDKEKEVRANAAMVMGRMQESSAIGPLQTRLAEEQESMVRLQIIEALAILGEQASALTLEAYTKKTPFLDERLVAIPAMAKVRSATAPLVLRELLDSRQAPRVRVSAAGALAMMGQYNDEGYKYCLEAVADPEGTILAAAGRLAVTQMECSSLQRLAAISLGWMNNPEAVGALYPLLSKSDSGVRIAAAMSILRLLSAYQESLPPTVVAGPSQPQTPAQPLTVGATVRSPETQPVGKPLAGTQPAVGTKGLVVGTGRASSQPARPRPSEQPVASAPATQPAAKETDRSKAIKPVLKTSGGRD